MFRSLTILSLLGALFHGQALLGAEGDLPPLTPQRHFNGIVAGEEAYQAGEARRRGELARQIDLNADMYWRWSGASSWLPGVFEAWPTVPGAIYGWPMPASPPTVRGTRVQPLVAKAPPAAAPPAQPPKARAPIGLPGFEPAPEGATQQSSKNAGPRAF